MKCASLLKSVVTLSILTTLISGCASMSGVESKKNLLQLESGMSQTKVLHLLGTPDSVIKKSESDDRWVYEYKRSDKHGHNIYLDFKNGNLTKTGELSGREIAAENENRESGLCTHHVHPEMTEESLCVK